MSRHDNTHEVSIALQSDKHPRQYAALARLIEGYGFDAIAVYGDLFFQPPIVPLTVIAQSTSRIRLGPASLNPWTLHPVEIAGQIAALDLLSDGRAFLGLARGAWLDEIGIEQQAPLERVAEAVSVVRQLLAGERAAWHGRYVRLQAHHALRYDVQRPRIPLQIGSWGRKLLTYAGTVADEVKVGGSTNPDIVPHVRAWLADGAASANREPSDIRIVLGAVTVVDEDRTLARRLVRREAALYLPVVARLDPTVQVDPDLVRRMDALVTAGDQDAAGALIPDDLLDRFAFAGTPADIIEQCERLFAAGVGRVEFGTPHGVTSERGIRLLGEKVLPELRRFLM